MFNRSGFRGRRSDVFGLLAAILLVLGFCHGLLFSSEIPFFRDLITYFYPLRFALHESYNAGNIPLWNRHMAMGFPYLADFQSGVFYPPHLLLAALPFFLAIRTLFVWHFLIAASGAYLLCRHWRYPVYLSIIGALLFTLGGTTVALTNLLNHFQTVVWLPWLVLGWERLLTAVSWNRLLALVVIAANAFLAGSPEIFVLCIALMMLAGVAAKPTLPQLSHSKVLGLFLAVVLLVAGLVMVQLLPSLELFFVSRRMQAIPAEEALNWSLNPLSLLNLFFIDKIVDTDFAVGVRLFFAREAPLLISYYLGAFASFGIALWLYFSSPREKLAVLSLGTCFLILALGSHTPIYPFLFRNIPMIGAVRFPEKFFFPTFALLVYAALKGVKALLHEDNRKTKTAYVIMTLICVVWVVGYLYLRSHIPYLIAALEKIRGLPSTPAEIETIVASFLTHVERQLIISLGFFGLFFLGRTQAIRRTLVYSLLVIAVFFDLAWVHKDLLFLLKPDLIRETPRIAGLGEMNGTRLFYYPSERNLHPSSVSVAGQPGFREATALAVQNLLPNTGLFYGFDYMQEIDALGRSAYAQFLDFANEIGFEAQLRLLRLCNIGYFVSFRERSSNGITLIGRFPSFYSWLYRVDETLPRAYIVGKFRTVENPAEALPLLADARFDARAEVIINGNATADASPLLRASAKIVRYEDSLASVNVTSSDDGILILTDSYYPGWRAYVDGREITILRANHFFRGVPVTRGAHVVEFHYDPLSFKLGLLVSSLTLLCILVISGLVYVRAWQSGRGSLENR